MSSWGLVLAGGVVADGLVFWSWVRWVRSGIAIKAQRGRTIMTLLSIIALTASCLFMSMVFAMPGKFWTLGDNPGDKPWIMVFMGGLAVAILGGVLAASALDVIRDLLGASSLISIVLWVALISVFEPGSW